MSVNIWSIVSGILTSATENRGKRRPRRNLVKDEEVTLMSLEVRLDRIQNEARKALGDVRKALEFHRKERQTTLYKHGVPRPKGAALKLYKGPGPKQEAGE